MRLLNYVRRYLWLHEKSDKRSLVLAAIFSAAIISCNTACPIYFKYLIETLSNKDGLATLFFWVISAGYGLIWTSGHLFCRVRSIMVRQSILRCLSLMTEDLYKVLLKSPLPQRSSDKLSLIERLNATLSELIEGSLVHLLPIFIEVLTAVSVVVYLTDVSVALVLLSTILAYLASLSISLKKIIQCQLNANQGQNQFLAALMDTFSNIEIVRLFNGYSREARRMHQVIHAKEASTAAAYSQVEKIGSVQFIIVGIGLVALTCMLTSRILKETISIGDLLLVHIYLMQLTLPLGYFGFLVASLQKGRVAFLEIDPLLETEATSAKMVSQPVAPSERTTGLELQLLNVSAAHNVKKILDNVSIHIPAGQVTGIAGASGQGKSSLLKVITQQLPITTGTIYVNQQGLQTISPATLRSLISVVPQDINLFNDTILANITYGCEGTVPPDQLNTVLEITHLSAAIQQLPNGLLTILGPAEAALSKGELQRITIARCFLKEAPLYLLDEPTAALDVKNEQEIMEKVLSYLKGKPVILVTHRPALLRKTDRVIIVNKGQASSGDLSEWTALGEHAVSGETTKEIEAYTARSDQPTAHNQLIEFL